MHHPMLVDGFDLLGGGVVPVTVRNARRFHRPLQFPDAIDAGLRRSGTGSGRD